ncbi:uncharacterized protein DFL_007096 [Arthrobotrys flagrans]|uniref:Protein kinase domain-containing protein n=1 Tax=Arthrobotrys flagrans TaxID=97331 RepID=A0A436ZUQ7_ARTFL|nr:hypothetical protein DFL_007096 [Arthrobotrys flagrans]
MSVLTLGCQVVDSEKNLLGDMFSLETPPSTPVSQFKVAIKARKPESLSYIDVDRLAVWKLSTPLQFPKHEEEEAAKAFNELLAAFFRDPKSVSRRLSPAWDIGSYFEEPAEQSLHLIIQAPPPQNERRDVLALSPNQQIEHTVLTLRSIEITNTKKINSIPGPSSAARPKAFRKYNGGPNPAILNLRPSDARGPPITLFHEVFGKFLQNLNNQTISATSERFGKVVEFMNTATNTYEKENARQVEMRPLFEELIGCTFLTSETDNGARINVSNVGGFFPLMAEYKHEIERMKNTRKFSCLPSILLAIEGPWLCVLGAIYHTQSIIEPLTDFIFCGDRPIDYGARLLVLTRLFAALSNAYDLLKNYYKTLESKIRNREIPIDSSLFPYRNIYSSNDSVVTFTYFGLLQADKLVWAAQTSQNESVIVKFTHQYCSDAHRLLAEAGFAPKLYYADENSTLQMIVMQHIKGTVFLSEVPESHRAQIHSQFRQALKLLHNNDFVFGDLRPSNILVTDDYQKVLLIDFDWSGKQGVARYPAGGVNREHAWPTGVEANGLIEKEHDLRWLQTLNIT